MTRRIHRYTLLAAFFLAGAADAATVQEAIDDPARPNADREEDDRRHPVEVMTFAGVTGGEVILEIGAGQGYTTELASRMVGKGGKVVAHQISPDRLIGNRLPNVIPVPPGPGNIADRIAATGLTAGSVDRVLAFFSLHDGYGNPDIDMQALYQALHKFLKPNGVLVVLDNSAMPGSGLASVPGLHRIDEAYLTNEILNAGFELAGESKVLRNPDDDLESSWFDDSATRKAGYQDRFALLFRKMK
ncbi:MAG TPA: methyltransferase domain-containing protein [Woeseiaceae bacterium]|nr:methyltransferase domain-containing protein [Woeseiaceae bacterium]